MTQHRAERLDTHRRINDTTSSGSRHHAASCPALSYVMVIPPSVKDCWNPSTRIPRTGDKPHHVTPIVRASSSRERQEWEEQHNTRVQRRLMEQLVLYERSSRHRVRAEFTRTRIRLCTGFCASLQCLAAEEEEKDRDRIESQWQLEASANFQRWSRAAEDLSGLPFRLFLHIHRTVYHREAVERRSITAIEKRLRSGIEKLFLVVARVKTCKALQKQRQREHQLSAARSYLLRSVNDKLAAQHASEEE